MTVKFLRLHVSEKKNTFDKISVDIKEKGVT